MALVRQTNFTKKFEDSNFIYAIGLYRMSFNDNLKFQEVSITKQELPVNFNDLTILDILDSVASTQYNSWINSFSMPVITEQIVASDETVIIG